MKEERVENLKGETTQAETLQAGILSAETLQAGLQFIKDIFQNDFSGHDYFHSVRVYKTARMLAEREQADVRLVSLAALLHDVDDEKLSPETHETKANAVGFLKSQKVSEEDIAAIVKMIDQVSFVGTDSVVPDTIEGRCVQDADRLDAIGAIGIARTFAYGGSHARPLYDPADPPKLNMTKEEYRNHKAATLNHFYEKLFLLKDMMSTKSGRELAEKRHAFMEAYVEQFLLEWEGKDLQQSETK